jgi:sigma-B regulation protein RsbU (phosphoserine phosphatase)
MRTMPMTDQRAALPSPAGVSRPRQILLADDDEKSRRLLGASLELAGFEVWTAGDGAEAMAAIESSPPDLLVLDFEMPGLNGADLCRRLRASEREAIRQLPVIMLTGHAGEAEEVGCLAAGANDFVTKPVGREVLMARIGTQLRLGALSDELRAQNSELARWRAVQEADLEAARATQQALVTTSPPAVTNWAIEVVYEPLIQVGGDVYGWRRLPGGRWLFWLADATGHGVAAALLTTLTALLFNHAAASATNASDILQKVNAEFWSVFRSKSFMTACCVVVGREGELSFAGAGHPPLFIRRTSGAIEELRSQGTILGLKPGMDFPQSELQLAAGDVALLYTDGLFGLKTNDGERLSHRTVGEALGESGAGVEVLPALIEKLREGAKSSAFDDDMAAIALRRSS